MRTLSDFRLAITFGIAVLVIIATTGLLFQAFGFGQLAPRAEKDAAATTATTLVPVLEREVDRLSDASFVNVASGLLSDDVRSIRLWSHDGELLATTGTANSITPDRGALAAAAGGATAGLRTGSPSGDLLATYAPFRTDGVVEVQQDYGPVAGAISSGQTNLLIIAAGIAAVLILVLPIAIFFALRTTKTEYNRLLYLYRSGQAIRSTLDLTDVLEQLARDAVMFVHADLGVVTMVEAKGDELVVTASFDRQTSTSAQHHRKIEEWYVRRCAATAQTLVTDVAEPPHLELLGHESTSHEPAIVLSVAIPGHERTVGILTIVREKSAGSIDANEVRVVEEMAAQAAVSVEQAALFSRMRRYADEVELSYDTTLKVLMEAIDSKDSTSQGHSERVARLTLSLAREMGVPRERLVDIERGAILHDVGKIGVPDEILRKPATLNDREWEAVQKHPLLAGMMVSKIGVLEGALPILLYHHERYDGNGYPFGLEGKAIPLEARIFAVVDAYDAMTSNRPYRNAVSEEDAVREVQRHAGTQFDPQIVEAFTRVMARPTTAQKRAA